MRQFIHDEDADWWMNGGTLDAEPFTNSEYLYKRMHVAEAFKYKDGDGNIVKLKEVKSRSLKNKLSALFPDIWIRHEINKGTTNYKEASTVKIEFVQIDYEGNDIANYRPHKKVV